MTCRKIWIQYEVIYIVQAFNKYQWHKSSNGFSKLGIGITSFSIEGGDINYNRSIGTYKVTIQTEI